MKLSIVGLLTFGLWVYSNYSYAGAKTEATSSISYQTEKGKTYEIIENQKFSSVMEGGADDKSSPRLILAQKFRSKLEIENGLDMQEHPNFDLTIDIYRVAGQPKDVLKNKIATIKDSNARDASVQGYMRPALVITKHAACCATTSDNSVFNIVNGANVGTFEVRNFAVLRGKRPSDNIYISFLSAAGVSSHKDPTKGDLGILTLATTSGIQQTVSFVSKKTEGFGMISPAKMRIETGVNSNSIMEVYDGEYLQEALTSTRLAKDTIIYLEFGESAGTASIPMENGKLITEKAVLAPDMRLML